MSKKFFICLILGLLELPSFAFFDGKVEKQYFYDNVNTIMQEEIIDNSIKTEDYWTNNNFVKNKYKPTFMLSNSDVIKFAPKQNIVEKNTNAPSVYNISLKNSSVVSVSFNKTFATTPTTNFKKTPVKNDKNRVYVSLYENAKVSSASVEEKMDTAIILKNTKNPKYYNMAISLLDDVTKIESYNAYAFYLKGELFALKHDNKNAIKNYVSSIKINPTNKNCYLNIAKLLESTNKSLSQKYYAKANNISL